MNLPVAGIVATASTYLCTYRTFKLDRSTSVDGLATESLIGFFFVKVIGERMDVRIEDATIRVLEELNKIERQSFGDEAFSKQQIRLLLEDYNSIALTARVGRQIAGFIIARIDAEHERHVGHIMTVDVAPSYRRIGIGTRLMSEVESILKQRNVSECQLEVREDNVAAVSLYRKLGYRQVGVLEGYYGKTNGLYLRKNLC